MRNTLEHTIPAETTDVRAIDVFLPTIHSPLSVNYFKEFFL